MRTTINGYPIVDSHPTSCRGAVRAGHTILVDRGEEAHERYVTAWVGEGDQGWWQGHYFASLREAQSDFARRIAYD